MHAMTPVIWRSIRSRLTDLGPKRKRLEGYSSGEKKRKRFILEDLNLLAVDPHILCVVDKLVFKTISKQVGAFVGSWDPGIVGAFWPSASERGRPFDLVQTFPFLDGS